MAMTEEDKEIYLAEKNLQLKALCEQFFDITEEQAKDPFYQTQFAFLQLLWGKRSGQDAPDGMGEIIIELQSIIEGRHLQKIEKMLHEPIE